MASTRTSTHPLQAYQPCLMTMDALKLTLESAMGNFYTEDRPSYKSVRVLLLHWDPIYDTDNEDYRITELVLQLAKVFKESYRYSVTTQTLGSLGRKSPTSSHSSDSPCNYAEGGHTLVIIHYIGQGDMVGDDLHIYPSRARREQGVNFTEVYSNAVQDSKTDVLTLLDCPYSGNVGGTTADSGRTEEIMAATADVAKNKDWSFTTNLVRELQHAANTKQILTTPQLYARIATNTTPPLPLHLQSCHHGMTHNRGPIDLSPLDKHRPPPTPKTPHGRTWKPAPYPLLLHQPLTVLLSVNLHGHNHHSLQQSLRHWACKQSASPISLGLIDRIRIMDAYQSSSSSSTILFQVTLDVWDTLPSHPAIQLVTFNMANPQRIIPRPPPPCLSETSSSISRSLKSSKSNSPLLKSEINGKYRISWVRLPSHDRPQKPALPREKRKKSSEKNEAAQGKIKEPSQSNSEDGITTPISGRVLVKLNMGLHRQLKAIRRRCFVF